MEELNEAQDERLANWLTLAHAPGIGARTASKLLTQFGSAEVICQTAHSTLEKFGLKKEAISFLLAPIADSVKADLDWLSREGNHILPLTHEDYPALLKAIADPPAVLYLHGNKTILSTPQLAIVGSRNPTSGGKQIAKSFAQHLSSSGLTITSGLALGIDGAAHEGTLKNGTSIAVMGTGLDRVYPAQHRDLAHQIIASGGALLSEFPLGTAPRPSHFPRRNRVISGLSIGTLVVESALQSGSLITARTAIEQGREVFAIPGSIHNPLVRGCHALIRDGAKLVETSEHILEELAPLLGTFLQTNETRTEQKEPNPEQQFDDDYQILLDAMGFDPVTTDQINALTPLSMDEISSMLLLLELEGYVSSSPGGRYTRENKTPDFK